MNRANKLYIVISLATILFLSGFVYGSGQQAAGITIAALGDIGCKSNSISNLKNLDSNNIVLMGIGDYLYKCNPSSVQKYYDNITKFGAKGNHEEKGEGGDWAKTNFRFTERGFGSWKYGDLGIILLNPYTAFNKNSEQYQYVVKKSETFANWSAINHIIYAVHEPLWTPTTEGGHGPNKDLRATYADIIKKHDGLLVQAHNHITAFGTVDGIPQVLCGGGGSGGDTLGKLNGWEWATDKPGYCKLTFGSNITTVQLIGPDNKILQTHTWP